MVTDIGDANVCLQIESSKKADYECSRWLAVGGTDHLLHVELSAPTILAPKPATVDAVIVVVWLSRHTGLPTHISVLTAVQAYRSHYHPHP